MDFKNDWRNRGQLDYLKGAELKYVQYDNMCKPLDHYHCDFCFDKMSSMKDTLNEGFLTKTGIYICNSCYEEFKSIFIWTVV